MPTELLSIGPVSSLIQNQVYALPAVACRIYTDNAATLLQSTTQAFTASTAVTLVEGGYLVSGGFLKLTSAGPVNVFLKRV